MNNKIIQLDPKDYQKCRNIWDMDHIQENARKWYDEIVSGNRIVFVYMENDEFIGEGALVLDTNDPDYTIFNQRVYVSRMIVKKERQNQGIGGIILDYLIDKAMQMGYQEMSLGVDKKNAIAYHLYKKKGFDTIIFDGSDEVGEYVKLLKYLKL